MKGFMKQLTIEQVQTNFGQAIEFVEMGKSLTITQDDLPTAMLFYFKEGSELLRLRPEARLESYLAARLKNLPQGVSELSMDDIHKLVAELRL
jgi:antitoxin (DNA-binding transcriptional repressor) of toxin-antitoxin stability system